MNFIKKLWAIIFSMAIVLFYSFFSSFFLRGNLSYFNTLEMPSFALSPIMMSLCWAVVYVLTIIVLAYLICKHNDYILISEMILKGGLNILWTIVFFVFKSPLGGFIVQIFLLLVSLHIWSRLEKSGIYFWLFSFVLFFIAYLLVLGFNVLMINNDL